MDKALAIRTILNSKDLSGDSSAVDVFHHFLGFVLAELALLGWL
jgi:hypothetical protein